MEEGGRRLTQGTWPANLERGTIPATHLPMWRESFALIEAALLHLAPVYYGLGAPRGDGSGVVIIPGFLGTDVMLAAMYAWLHRMDYRPYFSGLRLNAECPNLLIKRTLNGTLDRARRETGKKVHLVGHSLGGIIALAMSEQRPQDVASVTMLAAPFRGTAAHPNILRAAEFVRKSIREQHGENVLPDCYTGRCGCNFVDSLTRALPESVTVTAIYSQTDSIVDWRYCVTGNPELDFEVPGTHLGLIFNPTVYALMARRLALARTET